MAEYTGKIVHPQDWPEDLEYAGKTVVVIGSGATAATLIPAIAGEYEQVTMQRSPTYFRTGRNCRRVARAADRLGVDPRNHTQKDTARASRVHQPFVHQTRVVKQELLSGIRAYLGPDYDMTTHFTPKYRSWRQRIAFNPDGDFLEAIRAGKAAVVTNQIERFTKTGILLRSGRVLEADIIITATGFNLNVLRDIDLRIDGNPFVLSDTVTYRGMMFTGVPNMAWVFGYFRASWTLQADLVGDFVCRLVNHMKEIGANRVTPMLRPEDQNMVVLPWIDPENFNPGYLMRGMHLLPKRGDKSEWQHTQDYWTEKDQFPAVDLDDGIFVYE